MAPRIAPRPRTGNPPDVQELIEGAVPANGPTINIFLTLANHPGLLRRYLPFGGKLLMKGKLPGRERELVILRTAWLCQSDYEWGQHVGIGADEGLTDEEMARIPAGLAADGWSAFDAVLLQAADELVADHRLSDATWAALSERYDDQQMIELTLLVGNYVMVAGMLNSIGVKRESGVPGFP
ncbi:MAG TPA: carboxymuconolactone decarboxylase family protein [Acidimicrobiales bacterium]|jgi:alkylhydroperoxidase family enzyme